jgi:hypothetical protein
VTARLTKLVLDDTTIRAYAHGSVDVGELIAELADEHAGFAVPQLCLVEAATRLGPARWRELDLLTGLSHCDVVDWPGHWRDVAAAARVTEGGLLRAVPLLVAVARRAYLLTADPGAYGKADFVLPIDGS